VQGAEAKGYRRTLIALANIPVASVTTADVLAALESMPAVTAEKTRTRIACVLDWAKAMGYRQDGENVARRRGHMEFVRFPRSNTMQHFRGQRCQRLCVSFRRMVRRRQRRCNGRS
jgi:hypothetical protein